MKATSLIGLLFLSLLPMAFATDDFQGTLEKAEQGDAQAQYNVAVIFHNGELVKGDHIEALKWYRKAAENGHAEAQFNMFSFFQWGWERAQLPKDEVQAFVWLRKAADNNHPSAQDWLAGFYERGDRVEKNPQEAEKWYARAVAGWRKLAEQGDGWAMYQLGDYHQEGRGGLEKNLEVADDWYFKAAESKDHAGRYAARIALGIKWTRKAADSGDAHAQLKMGVAYEYGNGVVKDPVEAVRWYQKAADQGNADAQLNLAGMYSRGEGVGKNVVEAMKLTRKAAENGNALAQFNMGALYARGEGAIKDEIESLAWRYIAQANGADAKDAIEAQESLYGREATLLAQKRAREIQAEIKNAQSKVGSGNQSPGKTGVVGEVKSTGSGVFVTANGLILTAAHVVEDTSAIKVKTAQGLVPAQVVSIDRGNDVALLKVEVPGKPVPVKASSTVRLGQKVFTLGYPNPELQGSNLKMTEGSISSLGGIQDDPRQWQISVPVQPGNSGGPLFDEQGNLIGLVVAKLDAIKTAKFTGDLPQNVNYAVKSAYLLPLLEPHASKLAPENKPSLFFKTEGIVERSQDSVVLIVVY